MPNPDLKRVNKSEIEIMNENVVTDTYILSASLGVLAWNSQKKR